MACEKCEHTVGSIYQLMNNSRCFFCQEEIYIAGFPSTYLGANNEGFHEYRVHPTQACPRCLATLSIVQEPCQDLTYDGDYGKLFLLKSKHYYA